MKALDVCQRIREGVGGLGDVIAGLNVFIASMKRPEAPIKATNTQKEPTDREACSCLLLRAAVLLFC